MDKAKRNYFVDAVIGIAFLVCVITSLVFLFPINWIDFTSSTSPTVLGVTFNIWQTLHKWGGIAMMLGILLHLILHWKWIVNMTKKVFIRSDASAKKSAETATPATEL